MSSVVRFGKYEVDLTAGQLRKSGVKIKLRDQSFQVLASLVEHPGEVVTREELRRRLWHGAVFVDFENNLNSAVARLREALADSAEHPRYIETLPKRGYRFLPTVSKLAVPPPAPERRATLVVLPFVNLTGDPGEEYLSDAITDEIITALAGLSPGQLGVIARTTAMRYKGSHKDVARIGRDLAADYVVEGGVRHAEDRVAINVQLIQVSDQTHLFARKYETSRQDMFSTLSHAASDLAARIGVTPASREVGAGATAGARAARKTVPDVVAYKEYLEARRDQEGITAESLTRAKQCLEKAITHDPEFAAAYDALAETYWYMGYFGFLRPRDAFSAGIVHALRALEIDNTRAETHALLGQFHKTAKYDWPEVRREMALARQLDSNSPTVKVRYAVSELMPQGRIKEAITELERALELDPLSAYARSWLGLMFTMAGDYEGATAEALRALELEPANWAAYLAISACHRYRGNSQEAIRAQRECVRLSGDAAGMLGWLGLTLAAGGETAEARDILLRLSDMSARGYVPPTSLALIHLGLREIDLAFEWLDRAVEECDQFIMPIKSYGFFAPIRSDPRFRALLRKMNLES